MELAVIKAKSNPFTPFNMIVVLSVMVIAGWSWTSTEMSVTSLL